MLVSLSRRRSRVQVPSAPPAYCLPLLLYRIDHVCEYPFASPTVCYSLTMAVKTVVGLVPLVLAVPSYTYYIYSVYRRKTVPHMYSWLIWAILAGIGYAAQVSANAGPGAWNTGITAIVCFCVFLISIKYGEKKLSNADVILLVLASLAIIARLLTGNFVLAVLLTTMAALIGFMLTLKKAYRRPDQENATTFFINTLRSLISLFALASISFVTFFYPFSMMLANLAVTITVVSGRKSKSKTK